MKFRAIVELGGKSATGIPVPDEVVSALGAGKKPPVKVSVGRHEYRTTVAVMGGRFMIPLSADNRTKAGVAAGDEIEVGIELDDAPREADVPQDLLEELARHPEAKQAFEAMSYSNKKRISLSVESAKTAETRQRRVRKAIEELEKG